MKEVLYTNLAQCNSKTEQGYPLTSDPNKVFAKSVEVDGKVSYYVALENTGDLKHPSMTSVSLGRGLTNENKFKEVSKDLFDLYLGFLVTNSQSAYSQVSRGIG